MIEATPVSCSARDGLDRAVVELDALADPDRAGADDQRPLALERRRLRLLPRRSSRSRALARRTRRRRYRPSCRPATCRAASAHGRGYRRSARPAQCPICLSENPARFAFQSSSRSRSSFGHPAFERDEASSFQRNQRSIALSSWIVSTVTSRRRAAMSAHSRRSFGRSTNSRILSRSSPQAGSSQARSLAVVSSERTAFWIAPSNERSIAITSPVAFIWVLMVRSALRELVERPARDLGDARSRARVRRRPWFCR